MSMGLGAIDAVYQAGLNRYLLARELKDASRCTYGRSSATARWTRPCPAARSAWPLGASSTTSPLLSNANLQRLDGPVRGKGKIIQELEATFRGPAST